MNNNNPEIFMFVVALLSYLVAFALYSVSLGFKRQKLYNFARILNWIGAMFALSALLYRWYTAGHPPLSNMYESLVTLSTFIVLAGLMFTSKESVTLVEAGSVATAVLMIGIASVFPSNVRPLVPALNSYWLHLHVSLAFLGEACFAIAFVLSYLYCLKRLSERSDNAEETCLSRKEKIACYAVAWVLPVLFFVGMGALAYSLGSKPAYAEVRYNLWIVIAILAFMLLFLAKYLWRGLGKILPDAQKLDNLTYRAIAVGFPLFTVGGLIFGMIWANKAWGRYWGWDPKETWALITFFVYSIYLHVRLVRGWGGVSTACLSVMGFIVTMFTLFGVNLLISGLHSYI
ncbi:MAG: c-type cytochrome biogenesis protein CcsB [Candidatus Riflebacteria bacterium]|nr:c-type cytochrome biogenesis protein CcsB [Candidatus Riflebacteria bacterium]